MKINLNNEVVFASTGGRAFEIIFRLFYKDDFLQTEVGPL